jgi:hypothetical protein
MNFCRFQRFRQGQIRQDCRQSLRQHRLAGSGWTDEDDIVSSGSGDFQGALYMLLAFDLVKIGIVLRMLIE